MFYYILLQKTPKEIAVFTLFSYFTRKYNLLHETSSPVYIKLILVMACSNITLPYFSRWVSMTHQIMFNPL